MNKKKSSIFTSIRYLLLVPAGMALLLGNAVQATTSFDKFSTKEVSEVMDDMQEPQKKGDVYIIVDQMPSFPGGIEAQQRFIANNIKYPADAQKKGIQGKVTVRFIVKRTGEISNIEAIIGVDSLLDEEAVHVIKSMPKWIPGKENGKAVDVYYILSVVFKLAEREKGNTSNDLNGIVSIEDEVPPIIFKPDKSDNVNTSSDPNEKEKLIGAEVVSKEREEYIIMENSPRIQPFVTPQQMPSFPGGIEAMREFISKNLIYPVKAQDESIQGRVTVSFIVKSTGDISDASVVRGVDPELDKEALRMINSMPKWVPVKENGEAVDTYYTLPITFRLEE